MKRGRASLITSGYFTIRVLRICNQVTGRKMWGAQNKIKVVLVQTCCRNHLLFAAHLITHTHTRGTHCVSVMVEKCPTPFPCGSAMEIKLWLFPFVKCVSADMWHPPRSLLCQVRVWRFELSNRRWKEEVRRTWLRWAGDRSSQCLAESHGFWQRHPQCISRSWTTLQNGNVPNQLLDIKKQTKKIF